jgi:hypothetical protein
MLVTLLYSHCISLSLSHTRTPFANCRIQSCAWCTACCIKICAPESDGAQECSGEVGRAARACCSIARTLWRGIMSTRVIAMGCMYAQQYHELETRETPAPELKKMER